MLKNSITGLLSQFAFVTIVVISFHIGIAAADNKIQLQSNFTKDEVTKPIWEYNNFVDEFGDPTGEKYMAQDISGLFSNSATTNSCLDISFVVTKTTFDFRLYEYCRNHPVKNYHKKGTTYKMIIKTDTGAKHIFYLTNYSVALMLDDGFGRFYKQMADSKSLKIYISEEDRPSTTYKFSIDCMEFTKAFHKL